MPAPSPSDMPRRRPQPAGTITAEESAIKHLVVAQRKLKKNPHKHQVAVGIDPRLRDAGMEAISRAMHALSADYGVIVLYVEGTDVWVGRAS